MKSTKYLFHLLTILTISFTSCDIIEGPFMEDIVIEGCEGKCRKIFLEDYTGHKCGNCPRAAEKVEELKEETKSVEEEINNNLSKATEI